MAKELLPEELWTTVAPLLPPHPPRPKGGRKPVDDRLCLRGLIFILKTGMAYQVLPTEVFCVSGSTCWRRMHDWTRAGVWARLHELILSHLAQLDALDLDQAVIDSQSVRAVFGGSTPGPTQ